MRLPIVYHPDYNFDLDSVLGEQAFMIGHQVPYDTQRYQKILSELQLHADQVYQPDSDLELGMDQDQDLLLVHTPDYLERLNDPVYLASCFDTSPMLMTPAVRDAVIHSARLMTCGSLLATQLALRRSGSGGGSGWAINLGGGFHHAKSSSGGGECLFSDVALIVRKHTDKRILIVDLDAHRGDGYAQILKLHRHPSDDQRVTIFDIFNARKYPYIFENARCCDFIFPIIGGREASTDARYMGLLREKLAVAFEISQPELCIYIAGSDVYEGDPFGGLGLSAQGVAERDEYVFMVARAHEVPIVMLLGGGYADDNACVVGQSIRNLIKINDHRTCLVQ